MPEREGLGAPPHKALVLARELAVFLLFLLLAVALTWPLAERLDTTVSDLGDPLLNTWILDWDLWSVTHAPTRMYQASMFFPSRYPLAYSENLFGVALLCLPFYLAGCAPLVIYNIAMLLGFTMCGYGAYVLGRTMTRGSPASLAASLIAGILYAFVPYRFDHLSHLQIIWGGWLPLMLATLWRARRNPSTTNVIVFGSCVLMNGLTNVYFFLFGTLTVGITLIGLRLLAFDHDRRAWWRLVIASVVASALMVPVLMPYRVVSHLYGMKRGRGEAMEGSADWSNWLATTERSRTYGSIGPSGFGSHEHYLFPGLLTLFLLGAALLLVHNVTRNDAAEPRNPSPALLRTLDALACLLAVLAYIGATVQTWTWHWGSRALLTLGSSDVPFMLLVIVIVCRLSLRLPDAWGERRSLRTLIARSPWPMELWVSCGWIAVGVLGSFGLKAFFHRFLFRTFTVFQSTRQPVRWAMIAYVGLAAAGALGAAALIDRRRGAWRWVAALLLIALAIRDVRTRIQWEHAIAEPDPAYAWMKVVKVDGGTLELPVRGGMPAATYLLAATTHHRDILNGASGFEPPLHGRLRELSDRDTLGPEFLALTENAHCSLILVHEDRLFEQQARVHDWLRRGLAAHRIEFLRRFDAGPGGDWMFAIPRNLPGWQSLAARHTDGAGFSPRESLTRLLANQPTYSASTFGVVDTPKSGDSIEGTLRVAGWALAPSGIFSVDLLLNDGRLRIPMQTTNRGDVQDRYPWYPQVANPGFELIMGRPAGLPHDTDLQVEVVDVQGRRSRLPDVLIHW